MLLELHSADGCSAVLSNVGATLRSLMVPTDDGSLVDVVLGYNRDSEYLDNPWYLGCTVGRYAGRIADGRISLDGVDYSLSRNDNVNHLHGGVEGFHRRCWDIVEHGPHFACFSYTSPDGEEGYPGRLEVWVTYTLHDGGMLHIDYRASCDAATVLNLTNHSYFNLSGHASGSVDRHSLQVIADRVALYGDGAVPTGELVDVEGSPFDLRQSRVLEDCFAIEHPQLQLAGGIDHSWILPSRQNPMTEVAAKLVSPDTGIIMQAYTNQPTVHVYTGNFLPRAWSGKGGAEYGWRQGICLETQNLPNSPNTPEFPSTRLDPGQDYHRETLFAFSIE